MNDHGSEIHKDSDCQTRLRKFRDLPPAGTNNYKDTVAATHRRSKERLVTSLIAGQCHSPRSFLSHEEAAAMPVGTTRSDGSSFRCEATTIHVLIIK